MVQGIITTNRRMLLRPGLRYLLLYLTTISPDARMCPFMASITGVRHAR